MSNISKIGVALILMAIGAFLFGFLLFPDPDTVDACTIATCDGLEAQQTLSIIIFGVAAGFGVFGIMFALAGYGEPEEPLLQA